MSSRTDLIDAAVNIARKVTPQQLSSLEDRLKELVGSGGRVPEDIKQRLKHMATAVEGVLSRSHEEFSGVRDADLLTFTPDARQPYAVAGPLLLVVASLALLPSPLGFWAAMLCLVYALVEGVRTYVLRCIVDIPEGFEGVVCRYGQPMEERAKPGRTWCLWPRRFVPFLVSLREQVVHLSVAGFTGNYATITLNMMIAFKVVDSARFISTTSPSGIMKILALYARYFGQRMIVSIDDARVKFTGRDTLPNLVAALNAELREPYGIEVLRASVVTSENPVLGDLENVRTELNQVNSLESTAVVNREAAVKGVEQELRVQRKDARNKALGLRQYVIELDTSVRAAVSTLRQVLLISVQRELESRSSELQRSLAELRAAQARSRSLAGNLDNLTLDLKLRLARVRMDLMPKLKPERVTVLSVDGLGLGAGMSLGNRLVAGLLPQPAEEPAARKPAAAPSAADVLHKR